jgi:thymidylate synthase
MKIWDENGPKELLEKRGLGHRREGDLGPIYGFQWRHFGAEYVDRETQYTGKGVDQLQECVRKLKQDPTDRRIVLSAWNAAGTPMPISAPRWLMFSWTDLPLMALPLCHMMCQFYVHIPRCPGEKLRLSCLMYQRAVGLGLGMPFNIASYALLTHMVAHVSDTDPHKLTIQLGDAHVCRNHINALELQFKRDPRPFPKLKWKRRVERIDEFESEDIIVEWYDPHPNIPMKMSV